MKMRWVVTFMDDGSLKARLVVQGFSDQRLGKIPTSSPIASRRSRQIFLTLAASLGFQTHKEDVKCVFLQGDLDEEHADDNDDDACKMEPAQPVSDTFCEPVPELSRQLQLEHHQCVRLLKAVYGLVNAPRRWYDRVATDLRNMRGGESLMEPCLWTFRDENGVIHALCSIYMLMTSCWHAVTLHWENMSLTASTICVGGELGSHACSHSVVHGSHEPTTNTQEHGADLRSVSQNTRKKFRSSPCHHIDAETENPKSLHLSCQNFEPCPKVSCCGWVWNVCRSCWRLCHC